MAEDKKAAEQMVEDDVRAAARVYARYGQPAYMCSYEHGIPKDLPPGDGEGMMMSFVIGARDNLTKTSARKAAAMWRHVVASYPKAVFYLNLLGYDQDPREIWEITDAARYVRRFAREAGLDDPDEALGTLGSGLGNLGFLAACGVYGEELKQEALRQSQLKPTLRQ